MAKNDSNIWQIYIFCASNIIFSLFLVTWDLVWRKGQIICTVSVYHALKNTSTVHKYRQTIITKFTLFIYIIYIFYWHISKSRVRGTLYIKFCHCRSLGENKMFDILFIVDYTTCTEKCRIFFVSRLKHSSRINCNKHNTL